MITPEEIVKQARRIDYKSIWLSNHAFVGEYRSIFKGTGMQFKEVREYRSGDEERFIDWNVTARMGHHFTKVFEEEREMPIYVLADVSPSTIFGTSQSKKELMCQLCADMLFSAISNNDKIGVIYFSDKIDRHFPPQKNPEQIRYIIKDLFHLKSDSATTNFSQPLEFLYNILIHRSLIFIISDFIGQHYEKALSLLSSKHEVMGIQLYDKLDATLPKGGWFNVKDIESGKTVMLNAGKAKVRKLYQEQFNCMSEHTNRVFKSAGARLLKLETGKEYLHTLQKFIFQPVN